MTDTSYLLQYFLEHSPKEAESQNKSPLNEKNNATQQKPEDKSRE